MTIRTRFHPYYVINYTFESWVNNLMIINLYPQPAMSIELCFALPLKLTDVFFRINNQRTQACRRNGFGQIAWRMSRSANIRVATAAQPPLALITMVLLNVAATTGVAQRGSYCSWPCVKTTIAQAEWIAARSWCKIIIGIMKCQTKRAKQSTSKTTI